jgi:DNA-binding SARP family transcriptional activator
LLLGGDCIARLSIRLLGRLEIQLDKKPLSGLESDKVRALLAFLAVSKALPHRREKLATLLWSDWPEKSARANLRRALANLRKALGDREATRPFLLVTRQTIQFDPSSDAWVDVIAFTDLLSSGFPQPSDWARDPPVDPQTIRRLENAVELYRGEFLEGFSLADSPAFDEWVVFQQEQLHREVIDALRFLSDWYEDRSDWEAALQYAWRQVELDPWRESGHRQVMRLLAYSGQRSAALAQYVACCQLLDEELGVSPEEDTVRLYGRIRDGKLETPAAIAATTWKPEVTPRLPAFLLEDKDVGDSPPVFVAHEREMAQLDHFLRQAIGGQGQVVFITGGPGRGKTALIGEFAGRAMDTHSDLLVARGKCNAYVGLGDPYLPFREILAMLTGDVEAPWKAGIIGYEHARRLWKALPLVVQTLLRRGSQAILVLLSGAELLSRTAAAMPAGDPWLHRLKERVQRQDTQVKESEQSYLFQQVANALHDLAEVHPLLLILDDLQWIDTHSAGLLFHLGRRLGGSRILIAGAYRPEELTPGHLVAAPMQSGSGEQQSHPLEKLLGEFKRRFGDVWIDLAAVSEPEARHFVDTFLDTEPNHLKEGFRESLFRQTGGHPLFTIETLRAMQTRGDLLRDSDGCWVEGSLLDWKTLPARAEGVIEERIARLDDDLREILTVASVEGEEFTAAILAKVLDLDRRQLLHKLSGELEKRHRLVQQLAVQMVGPHRLVRYRFAHPLVQQYLYNQLGEGERLLLHHEIAGIVEALQEGVAEEIAAQLAYNYAGDAELQRY